MAALEPVHPRVIVSVADHADQAVALLVDPKVVDHPEDEAGEECVRNIENCRRRRIELN